MAEQAIVKEYSNDEITVIWQPAKCIHSAICFHHLPEVFQPQERPWVKIGGAETQRIIAQVQACPSGALSYKLLNNQATESAPVVQAVKVKVAPNGPLIVQGSIEVEGKDGVKTVHTTTALCRCGASVNKPYCDGSHKKVNFTDN